MADKKATITTHDDGSKAAHFDVDTTLGPVHVAIPADSRPDLTAADAEAEAMIHARELRGGVPLAANKSDSDDSDAYADAGGKD